MKNKVYATPPINVDNFRIRITSELNILEENPDLMKKNEEHQKKRTGLRIIGMAVKSKEDDHEDSCFQ